MNRGSFRASPNSKFLAARGIYPKKGGTEVFLLATSQAAVKQHLNELADRKIDPDVVSCTPLALFRFASHFFPEHPSLFVYHSEGNQHTFVIIKEGKLTASQVQKTQDFERMCAYLQKKYPEITNILNTGEGNIPSPFIPIVIEDPNLALYAIPIGLCLDAAKADQQSAQLRQNGEISKKQLQKKKKELTGFLAACFSFIIVTLLLGQIHLKSRENAILKSLGNTSGMRLHQYVQDLDNSLRSRKKSEINIPTIPKVHEVLTWLSLHPALSEECSITHLKYNVLKAPKLGSDVKGYVAAVDLELSMPSSKVARTFHEALLRDTEMVDHKNPITWNGDHGIYRAQFNLKSKLAR